MKKFFSTLLLAAFLMPLTVWAAKDSAKNLETASSAYDKATSSKTVNDYEKALNAINIFLDSNEGNHMGNTSEMMEDCKLHIYNYAVLLFNQAKENPSKRSFESAQKAFEKLQKYDYKDVKAYIEKCKKSVIGAVKIKLADNAKSVSFDNDAKDPVAIGFAEKFLMKKVEDFDIKTTEPWLKGKIEDNGTVTLTAERNEKPEARTAMVEFSGKCYADTAKTKEIGNFITYCKVSQASNETVFLPVIELKSTTEGVETFAQAIQCNDDWTVNNKLQWVEAYKEGDALKLKYKASETKRSGDLVIKTKTDGKEIKFHVVQEKYVPQPEPEPNPGDGQGGSSQIADEDLDAKIAKVNSSSVSDYSFGTTQVSTDQVKELIDLYEVLKKNENATVTIYGNTCSIGSEKANEKVGLERAESAKAFLVNLGIAPERISAVSNGESAPVADNSTAEGRAKNRRLTFDVKK